MSKGSRNRTKNFTSYRSNFDRIFSRRGKYEVSYTEGIRQDVGEEVEGYKVSSKDENTKTILGRSTRKVGKE